MLAEVPPPRRLAPFSVAISATVPGTDDDLADGTFVVLYDPAGQVGWTGPFRIVLALTAPLEPELAQDALLPAVAWSWLLDAFEPVGVLGLGGTVTRTLSEPFGELASGWATRPVGLEGLIQPSRGLTCPAISPPGWS
jgi:hypothetical protein